jgi:hypothetical protein
MIKNYFTFNNFMQAGLVASTIAGVLLTSLKLPQYGLIVMLISEFFWLYSSYKAWKEAGQVGIFITTIVYTMIVFFGIINYWFL